MPATVCLDVQALKPFAHRGEAGAILRVGILSPIAPKRVDPRADDLGLSHNLAIRKRAMNAAFKNLKREIAVTPDCPHFLSPSRPGLIALADRQNVGP